MKTLTRGFGGFSCAAVFSMLAAQAGAADYTYLFDASTRTVGEKIAEYLQVEDYCPKTSCTASEKLKRVTAETGRTGRLEFIVNAGSNFEISFGIGAYSGCSSVSNGSVDLVITLYMTDGTSLSLPIGSCAVYSPNGWKSLSWLGAVNDFRLISENGMLKITSNDVQATETPFTGTINRVVVSKINAGQEYLMDIRTRGIQATSATSCPTTGGTSTASAATLDSNLNMHIPSLVYQPLFGNSINLWTDLQFSPATDGSLIWKLSNYGVNP